jgi:hypothetical protein
VKATRTGLFRGDPRAWPWILFLGGPFAFGLLALWLGQDLNWDLRNYHYYNPHALLDWRYELDVAPAQLQTYFNPLVDIPFYLLIKSLPAWGVGFVAGAFQGLSFSLVALMTWIFVEHPNVRIRALTSLASAAVGCAAPAFMGELGSLVHDNTLSVLVLTAIAILSGLIRYGSFSAGWGCYLLVAVAGFLMGTATALKLPNAVFALGSALALPFVARLRGCRTRIFSVYAAAGMLAGILFLLPWMWFLWDSFGNPLFPFFNNLFQSPAAAPSAFGDLRFRPSSFQEYLIWPLIFSGDSRRVWEVDAQDYRFALLWCAAALYLLCGALQRLVPRWMPRSTRGNPAARSAGDFLLLFTLFSFLLWMARFYVYRYLTPLELIAPLVFGVLVSRLGVPRRFLVGLLAVLGIAIIIMLHAPNQKRQAWSARYFEVDTSAIPDPGHTIVLMLGGAPMSYVIPELPSGPRFLRPEGNLSLREGDGLMARIRSALEVHAGPVLILFDARDPDVDLAESSHRFGLSADEAACRTLETNVPDDLRICFAVRSGPRP